MSRVLPGPSPLVRFIQGFQRQHPAGYHVRDISFSWQNDKLEALHDWVQWCFPLQMPSMYVPDAPMLTVADLQFIQRDDLCQENLEHLRFRMHEFYAETKAWRLPRDHNHARITRILKSTALCTGPLFAKQFHDHLMSLGTNFVNSTTKLIWQQTIGGT
jgi:hypothetical protein